MGQEIKKLEKEEQMKFLKNKLCGMTAINSTESSCENTGQYEDENFHEKIKKRRFSFIGKSYRKSHR